MRGDCAAAQPAFCTHRRGAALRCGCKHSRCSRAPCPRQRPQHGSISNAPFALHFCACRCRQGCDPVALSIPRMMAPPWPHRLPAAAEVLAVRTPPPCALVLGPAGLMAFAAYAEPASGGLGAGTLLRGWDLRRGTCAWQSRLPCPAGALASLAASHDGRHVFAACETSADVAVFDARDGAAATAACFDQADDGEAPAEGITALSMAADGAVLCVARRDLRVDAYALCSLVSGQVDATCDAAAALAAHPGARISALALCGAGSVRTRSVFLTWQDGIVELSLAAGAVLRVLRSTPPPGGWRALACAEPGGGRVLLYAGAPHHGVHVFALAAQLNNDCDTEPSALLPPADAAAGAGVFALFAGGACCAATGGAALIAPAHDVQADTAAVPAHTTLLAGACEAFVALAASPCGVVLVAAAAAPRGCALRRFRLCAPRCFSRASFGVQPPELRAAVRAFLLCVGRADAAPHALARLDAATQEALLDNIFALLVRVAAADARDAARMVKPRLLVEAPELPRARDCARGLVMHHASALEE